jgi:hypothetical protein
MRHLSAHGEEGPDRLCAKTGQGEAEGRERRGVQPLEVVDGHKQRIAPGQRLEGAEERDRDHVLLDVRRLRLGEEQRRLECPSLRRPQLRQRLLDDVADQVAQPGERVARFCFGRAAGEDAIATHVRRLDAGQPQRRLPDAGLAGQQSGTWQLLASIQEG